jgi:hypothetical protein
MSRIASCPAAAFVVGVVLAVALIGGVVMAGVVSLEFGAESGEAAPKPLKTAFARVTHTKNNANNEFFEKSRGVVDVAAVGTGADRVYCFDLSFVPKVAAVSPYFTNNATVAVWLPGQSGKPSECTSPHTDAAAKTYAADTSEERDDLSFNIIFHG